MKLPQSTLILAFSICLVSAGAAGSQTGLDNDDVDSPQNNDLTPTSGLYSLNPPSNDLLVLASEMQKIYDDTLAQLIIANLKLAKYSAVESDWKELNKASYIRIIIQGLYSLETYEQMAQFALIMPNSSDRIDLCLAWYDLIVLHKHLEEWRLIILRKLVFDEVSRLGATSPEGLVNLRSRVDTASSAILDSWAFPIRSQSYQPIVDLFSPTASYNFIGLSFNDTLEEVIKLAYRNNRSALGPTAKFVLALNWNLHRATGLAVLKTLVLPNVINSPAQDEIFVALKVKEALERSGDGPDPEGPPRATLTSLRNNSFRKSVNDLLFHTHCKLFNKVYEDGKLYVGGAVHDADASQRRVYCKKQIPVGEVPESRFKFTPLGYPDYVHFHVESAYFQSSRLRAYKNLFDSQRWSVSSGNTTSNPSTAQVWIVEPVAGTPDQIRLKNVYKQGYLYASTSNEGTNKRVPYLWLPSGFTASESNWRLECQ